jgi:6-phosphogluconolactonase
MSGTGEYGLDVDLGLEPGVPIPTGNVHPFPCTQAIGMGRGAEWCAAQYTGLLEAELPVGDAGWPVFDLILVGVGKDGHVLSVFPGSAAFDRSEWALAVPAPTHIEPHLPRVTLNPAILDAAVSVLAVAHGIEKTDAIGQIFGSERDERALPAQRLLRPGVTWILDRAAAGRLAAGTP